MANESGPNRPNRPMRPRQGGPGARRKRRVVIDNAANRPRDRRQQQREREAARPKTPREVAPVTGPVSVQSGVTLRDLSQALDESPLLTTVTVTGPMQEEDMVKLLFRQIKKAALLPLRGDMAPELVNAKTHASGNYYMALDSNPGRAYQFSRSELFGLGVDYPILLPARIEGVTSEDLLRIGQKYFQRGQWDKAPYAVAETRPGGW